MNIRNTILIRKLVFSDGLKGVSKWFRVISELVIILYPDRNLENEFWKSTASQSLRSQSKGDSMILVKHFWLDLFETFTTVCGRIACMSKK